MRAEVVGFIPHTSCPRLQPPCGDRELDANSNPPTRTAMDSGRELCWPDNSYSLLADPRSTILNLHKPS
jgi:hypothetical protein